MLKNDTWIRKQANTGMIKPFCEDLVREATVDGSHGFPVDRKVLSYGCSSYGYDLRLSPKEFLIFKHVPGTVVDPKNFSKANLEEAKLHSDDNGDFFILPARSYGLGVAIENLNIPNNITCLFIGKSTYARAGIIANLTPGESGWKGHLTLEFSNSSGADCRIYANEGIVQTLFFEGEPCEVNYQDRAGKYQNQSHEVTLARV
jgi:dCTP deaminase